MVLTVPMVVWWLLGDLSGIEPGGSDQIISVPALDPNVERAFGVVAVVVLSLSCLALWRMCARRLDSAWFGVLGRLAGATALLAGLGRVVTANTTGANIGGGMIAFVGLFLVLYLVARAWDAARSLLQ